MPEDYPSEAPLIPYNQRNYEVEAKLAGSSRYFTYREKIDMRIKEFQMLIDELEKAKALLDSNSETERLLDQLRKLGI